MLPKEYRLKNNSAFSATFRLKNILSNDILTLYYGAAISDETQHTKIGFIVSKKVHKRAVKRNRIKRLMREIMRLKIKSGNTQEFVNLRSLILIAKPKSCFADYKTMESAINEVLKRIKQC